mmetsp:Transcript_15058/g.18256  ORF Transcript_15058/g.18256 Transcript_15058/m.18256 type:complete len:232 (-) Transcript_15058:71-766(-)
MSSPNCVELVPLSVCGHGNCAMSSFCECDSGWSKTTEFALYLTEEQYENGTENLTCDTQTIVLRILYGVAACFHLGSVVVHLLTVKKKSQLKRLTPLMIAQITTAAYSILRVVDIDRRITEDILATFMFAISLFFASTAPMIFYNKFIAYQAKSLPIGTGGSENNGLRMFKPNHLKRAQYALVTLDLVCLILLLVSPSMKQWKPKVVLLKWFFGLHSFRMLYNMWANHFYV